MEDFSRTTLKPALIDLRAPQSSFYAALDYHWYRVVSLLLSDVLALALSWRIAVQFNQFYSPLPPQLTWGMWLGIPWSFWVFASVILLLFVHYGLYSPTTQWKNYVHAGQIVSFVYLFSLVLGYFYDPKLDAPRSLFFTAWFSSVGFVIGLRLLTAVILRQFEQTQVVPVFLIAPAQRLPKLAKILQQRSHYKVVGAALSTTAHTPITLQMILASGAQEVLAENLPPTDLASTLFWQLRRVGVTLRLIPSSLEMLHRRGVPEFFAGLATLRVETPFPLLNGWDYRLKRWIDFIGALLVLIFLSPLFLAIAIAIKLSSPGPVFFRQERMGLHGRIFQMWKFRTMIPDAAKLQASLEDQNEIEGGVMFKLKGDPRITNIGQFLRRTSLDELPQLFNVLLGQMSLVGPRPLPLRDVVRFEPCHHIRHQVLPGITGIWQISGRSDIQDFRDVVRLDLYYIDNWSLNLDLDILVETARIVLFGKGAY